jgi:hypothetical protein
MPTLSKRDGWRRPLPRAGWLCKSATFTRTRKAAWDAIEPLRPAIDTRVFAYIASREFARSDFPQTSATKFRLARDVIGEMLDRVCLPEREIASAADFMLQTIERYARGERRLFKDDLRRQYKKKVA